MTDDTDLFFFISFLYLVLFYEPVVSMRARVLLAALVRAAGGGGVARIVPNYLADYSASSDLALFFSPSFMRTVYFESIKEKAA